MRRATSALKTSLDNLIYRREIPVMIGVFINPGKTPEQPEPTPKEWGDRTTNRPTEYNTPDDKYARVICDELMPVLYKEYNISKDPEQHGIGGASSGAIAAFIGRLGTARSIPQGAQHCRQLRQPARRPRLSGACAGQRQESRSASSSRMAATTTAASAKGRQYDPKRDWFYQNVRLVDALTKKGYDVNNVWGIGRHGTKQGGAILPDMMRWLWRDHPVSVDVKDKVERSFQGPAAKERKPQSQMIKSRPAA